MGRKKNSEKEIFDFLYGVMRGEIMDNVQSKEKDENGEYIYKEVPVSISIRMKAAELLFKSVSHNESSGEVLPVVISEDIV